MDQHQRDAALQRLSVLDALALGLERRDELLPVLDAAATDDDAAAAVGSLLNVNASAAAAVLDMSLRRFTAQNRQRINDERQELRAALDDE